MAGVMPSATGGANPWGQAIQRKQPSAIRTVIQNQQYNAGLKNALQQQALQNQGLVDVSNRRNAPQLNQAIGAQEYAKLLGITPGAYAQNLEASQMGVNEQAPTAQAMNIGIAGAPYGIQNANAGKYGVSQPDKSFMNQQAALKRSNNNTYNITDKTESGTKYNAPRVDPETGMHVSAEISGKDSRSAKYPGGVQDTVTPAAPVAPTGSPEQEQRAAMQYILSLGIPNENIMSIDPQSGQIEVRVEEGGKVYREIHSYR